MNTDFAALIALATAYFDAAYAMDADQFAALFHPCCSVTRAGEDDQVNATPIDMWLAAVRGMQAPKLLGLERRDEILSVEIVAGLAVVKLKLQMPPRYFTDVLSCVKTGGAWKIVQKVTAVETR